MIFSRFWEDFWGAWVLKIQESVTMTLTFGDAIYLKNENNIGNKLQRLIQNICFLSKYLKLLSIPKLMIHWEKSYKTLMWSNSL